MSVFATEGLLNGPDTVQRGVRGQRGAGVASRSSVGAALAQSWVMLETEYLTVTRAAYDTIASDYARVLDGALARMSWDRAVLCTFAELVARDRLGPVADVGCGTGRITGYLHHLGLDVVGIDLSPGMLAVARQALPGLCFVGADDERGPRLRSVAEAVQAVECRQRRGGVELAPFGSPSGGDHHIAEDQPTRCRKDHPDVARR